jgi:hypothetical protein
MAEIPVIPIASVWARRVSSAEPHPVFELGVTLADGSELPLGAYDLFATTLAHISGDGIREALRRREEVPWVVLAPRRLHTAPAPCVSLIRVDSQPQAFVAHQRGSPL